MQKIYPALHMLEIFQPLMQDERFFVDEMISRIPDIPFYKGIELGVFYDKACRKDIRKIVEDNKYQLTVWVSPTLTDYGYDLSSTDESTRKKAVARMIEGLDLSAEMGVKHCGIPCGPYPGPDKEEAAMEAFYRSIVDLLDVIDQYPGVDYIFEPLVRYANKRMLCGPMPEAVKLFARVAELSGKFYMHWDSAHEMLNKAPTLSESMEIAHPYIAQIHLCNCVTDPNHPYYGDWHMDVGEAPEYKNWGYLTPEVGAAVIKQLASYNTNPGLDRTFCSVEVKSAKGNDLWAKERLIRGFLQKVFDLAGNEYDK